MSELYDIYKRDTFTLAKSAVIKFELISEQINRELIWDGFFVDKENPYSHKYYLNLSGEYHESDHISLEQETGNRYMVIDIADNLTTKRVQFTKSLFHGPNSNVTLLNEYQIGSEYYTALVTKYPKYKTLIDGILTPNDLDTVVKAKDGCILALGYKQVILNDKAEVLGYKLPEYLAGSTVSKLIEDNEYNLITELQLWVDKVYYRWMNKGYTLTDDLYLPFFLGTLYTHMTAKIMNIRMKNTHTAMVHSFHVGQYLESNGALGKYIPFIPKDRALYLYRNVRYLQLNFGKTFTFKELISHMLNPVDIPLAGYNLRHDISNLNKNGGLLPETKMYKEHLNFRPIGGSTDIKSVRHILNKQIPLARENERYIDEVERETEFNAAMSLDDKLITKVLESEMYDISEPAPVDLVSMLIWNWAFTSSKGYYTGSVYLANPVNDERIVLSPKNAFILWLYCLNRGYQRKRLVYIPSGNISAMYIPRHSNPVYTPEGYDGVIPASVLKTKVESKYITDQEIVSVLLDNDPVFKANSPVAFNRNIKAIHKDTMESWFNVCRIDDMYGRGYGDYIFDRQFWHNVPIHLTSEPTKYDVWLRLLGIDFNSFSDYDFQTLAVRLVSACITGVEEAEYSKAEMQRAMIGIMKHFSSYTTHYLADTNDTNVVSGMGKFPRITNQTLEGDYYLETGVDISVDIINQQGEGEGRVYLEGNFHDIVDAGYNEEVTFYGGVLDTGPNIAVANTCHESVVDMHDISILDINYTYEKKQGFKPFPPPPPSIISTRRRYLVGPPRPYSVVDVVEYLESTSFDVRYNTRSIGPDVTTLTIGQLVVSNSKTFLSDEVQLTVSEFNVTNNNIKLEDVVKLQATNFVVMSSSRSVNDTVELDISSFDTKYSYIRREDQTTLTVGKFKALGNQIATSDSVTVTASEFSISNKVYGDGFTDRLITQYQPYGLDVTISQIHTPGMTDTLQVQYAPTNIEVTISQIHTPGMTDTLQVQYAPTNIEVIVSNVINIDVSD